jgi:1-deoxy-D-xylulose-5-phosphate reductoisomerase
MSPKVKDKRLLILGSTGSIGLSTIDVIGRVGGYRVVGLAASRNIRELEKQVRKLRPKFVAVSDLEAAHKLRKRVGSRVEVLEGPEGVAEMAGRDGIDIVVSAIVGSAGLRPTFEAVKRGRIIALANKETLVAGGELISRTAARTGARFLPVDSEHSAIFQCIDGKRPESIRRILLTGSGGPFRGRKNLRGITVRDALNHPTWNMGKKVTIDSATLMNKGLEVIEAHWLFGVPVEKIEVVIHPQSIVHSLVEFMDGSVIAQLGLPDMRLPIQYALAYPERLAGGLPRLDLHKIRPLTFELPDNGRFPCLNLARLALARGGSAPVVLNAANEVAVEAFLGNRIPFTAIPSVIMSALNIHKVEHPSSVERILAIDREARTVAAGLVALGSRS